MVNAGNRLQVVANAVAAAAVGVVGQGPEQRVLVVLTPEYQR